MRERRGRQASSLRRALIVLPIWLLTMFWMWIWWLEPGRSNYLPLFVPLTVALFYEFAILPSAFLYFILKAKSPSRRIAPKGNKVAVISLCVPSTESLDIVEKQLKAMSEITYPHDSWILDEGNSKKIKALAKQYGVKHFSRKGIKKYNEQIPPFQTKTKAGNVNAWLDFVKRRKYEYFVQFDIDHIAKPNYLQKILGHFRDPKVAWVQAPSVYGNRTYWTARAAAEEELVLQGPLQMGFYGHSETPFIIGSHCTYRMSAIREIGGFQPTRAEDHLDTVVLANHGYKGVFIPEVIAEGDGPETLAIYLAQQFAWAYSMFQVLLFHSPKLLKKMSWGRRAQFLFAQTWYPLWSFTYLILFMSPIAALMINKDIANVEQMGLLTHFVPMFVCAFLIWWAARPLMQPRDVFLSWRSVILHAVRWPIILRAIFSAAFRIKKPYMITPKGSFSKQIPVLKTYQPFLILGFASVFAAAYSSIHYGASAPQAQIIFTLANAGFMLTICSVDIGIRLKEAKPKMTEIRAGWLKPIGATVTLALFMSVTFFTSSILPRNSDIYASRDSSSTAQVSASQPVNYGMSTEELITQIKLVDPYTSPTSGLGMYNPRAIDKTKAAYIEHSFTDWQDVHYIAYVLAKTVQSGNTPLITIEPRGEQDGVKLLNDINSGQYDERLSEIAKVISASKNPVYIRFAHEMELSDLYAWSNNDPQLFISAYRHTIDYFRNNGHTNVKWVWSPAGNYGADLYYPGDEYVDVIGTTILFDQYWYGPYQPSFYEVSVQRSALQAYNKPVWIVEFGVGKANSEFQKTLINDAIANYVGYGYQALIYINISDSNIQGPDYRLSTPAYFNDMFGSPPPPTPAPQVKPEPKKPATVPVTIKKVCPPEPQLLGINEKLTIKINAYPECK